MGGARGMPMHDGKYIVGGKPEEPRKRWVDNIKVELNDISCECCLDKLNQVLHFRFPKTSVRFLE
jgi:hypothetical protein